MPAQHKASPIQTYLYLVSAAMLAAPFFSSAGKAAANVRNWQLLAAAGVLAWAVRDFRKKRADFGQLLDVPVSTTAYTTLAAAGLFAFLACAGLHFAGIKLWEDFALFDWQLYNSHSGTFMYSPVCECNHLGMHASYILLPLVPLHALFESRWFLTAVHALTAWSAIFPLRGLAEHFRLAPGLQALLLVAFLTSAMTGQVLNTGFHIETFYLPLGLMFLLGWVTRKNALLTWALFGLLMTKEDAPIYVILFTVIAAAMERRWRLGAAISTACLTTLVINLKFLQPHFREIVPMGNAFYLHFWHEYGRTYGEIALYALTHPLKTMADIIGSNWLKFFAPTLFLPWLSLPCLAIFLFVMALFGTATGNPLMQGWASYYPAPVLPFILLGFLQGYLLLQKRLGAAWSNAALALALFIYPLAGGGYMRFPEPLPGVFSDLEEVAGGFVPPGPVCTQNNLLAYVPYEWDARKLTAACMAEPHAVGLSQPDLNPYPLSKDEMIALINGYPERRYLSSGLVFFANAALP